MGWVGHPAHMGTLWVPIIGRDLFYLVARPLAFGSLPAPMVWVGHPHHMGTLWVPIYVTIMGHPMGAPYVHPYGVHIILLFGRSSTRLRLVTGSNGHPLGAHMHTPKGVHYKRVSVCAWKDVTLRVNFGQNYRDLGHNLRIIFLSILPATLRGPQWAPCGHPYGYP